MDRFIHRENLAHYRRLLAERDAPNDQARYDVLSKLLASEEARERDTWPLKGIPLIVTPNPEAGE